MEPAGADGTVEVHEVGVGERPPSGHAAVARPGDGRAMGSPSVPHSSVGPPGSGRSHCRFRHVPVVDRGRVVGVVSRGDFLGLEQARLDEETALWERI